MRDLAIGNEAVLNELAASEFSSKLRGRVAFYEEAAVAQQVKELRRAAFASFGNVFDGSASVFGLPICRHVANRVPKDWKRRLFLEA